MINGGGMMMVVSNGPGAPAPGGAKNPANARWNWHRMQLFANMAFSNIKNDTDGAFSTPTTGRLLDDWGPSANDIHRRFNVNWSSAQLRNLNATLSLNASSAQPYTILSGFDTNGDLIFNDRPAGIGRNTARGSAQWTMNGFFSYGWQFGKPVQMPGGVSFRSDGGALTATQAAGASAGRFRLSVTVNVQNLTNRSNLGGYVGTLTSQAFGQPTTVLGTRKIDIGMGISF
jgi:hypothetical protein